MQISREYWKTCMICEHVTDDDEALYCSQFNECERKEGG